MTDAQVETCRALAIWRDLKRTAMDRADVLRMLRDLREAVNGQ